MAATAIALLFASLLTVSHCGQEELDSYRFNAKLSDTYTIYWSFDLDPESIHFAVSARTTGWVGFGLSPNGQMPRSDVVIGWVANDGTVSFHVRNSS